MTEKKRYYFLAVFLALPVLLLQTTGCQKEYSYEGGDSTALKTDSVAPLPLPVAGGFPICSSCRPDDALLLSQWNFKTSNSFLCGVVANAGIDHEKKSFTLFGPSDCSIDTGLVMTIYLPTTLDQDLFNISTTKVAFFYYNHHATKDIFISEPEGLFTVNVESYIYATGIVNGTFNGTVFTPNGDMAYIDDGKFRAKLR